MAATLYATVAQLQSVMGGTDAGSGTAAQLSPSQLTLALTAASNRVSVFAGNVFDSSTPAAVPPAIFQDLTLDLAAFWANVTYLKHKAMGPDDPVRQRYNDAVQLLRDVRDGKVRLDVGPPGSVGAETGHVNNPLPNIFTHDDSSTRFNVLTGGIEADSPYGQFRPGWTQGAAGAEYQG